MTPFKILLYIKNVFISQKCFHNLQSNYNNLPLKMTLYFLIWSLSIKMLTFHDTIDSKFKVCNLKKSNAK